MMMQKFVGFKQQEEKMYKIVQLQITIIYNFFKYILQVNF